MPEPMSTDGAITDLHGPYYWLDNFYPFPMVVDGETYATVENYYQAMKAVDPAHAATIRESPDPGFAKSFGNRIPIRPDWERIKIGVMKRGIDAKFSDLRLRSRLYRTGERVIIEGNSWNDRFWGQCPLGDGDNWLGRLLMAKRSEIAFEIALASGGAGIEREAAG